MQNLIYVLWVLFDFWWRIFWRFFVRTHLSRPLRRLGLCDLRLWSSDAHSLPRQYIEPVFRVLVGLRLRGLLLLLRWWKAARLVQCSLDGAVSPRADAQIQIVWCFRTRHISSKYGPFSKVNGLMDGRQSSSTASLWQTGYDSTPKRKTIRAHSRCLPGTTVLLLIAIAHMCGDGIGLRPLWSCLPAQHRAWDCKEW
jgi:hypothetical protein